MQYLAQSTDPQISVSASVGYSLDYYLYSLGHVLRVRAPYALGVGLVYRTRCVSFSCLHNGGRQERGGIKMHLLEERNQAIPCRGPRKGVQAVMFCLLMCHPPKTTSYTSRAICSPGAERRVSYGPLRIVTRRPHPVPIVYWSFSVIWFRRLLCATQAAHLH